MGPWLVTSDEVPDPQSLDLSESDKRESVRRSGLVEDMPRLTEILDHTEAIGGGAKPCRRTSGLEL